MARAVLQEILSQLKMLEVNELQELDQAVQEYIVSKEGTSIQTAFYQALLDSGLVRQIKQPVYRQISLNHLIQVQGLPLSETIVEERQ